MKKIRELKKELQQLNKDIEKFNNCLGVGYYDLYYKDLSYIDDEKLKNELIEKKENLKIKENFIKVQSFELLQELKEMYNNLDNYLTNTLLKIEKEELYYVNAKLHDLSMYLYDIDPYNDHLKQLFYDFCKFEWENFQDYLKEQNCKIEFLNMTSIFKILDACTDFESLWNLTEHDTKNSDIYELEELLCNEKAIYLSIDECYKIIELYENKDDIFKEVYENIKYNISDFENVRQCYTYLENFKQNQIKYFEAYCEGLHSEIAYVKATKTHYNEVEEFKYTEFLGLGWC